MTFYMTDQALLLGLLKQPVQVHITSNGPIHRRIKGSLRHPFNFFINLSDNHVGIGFQSTL